MRPIRAPRECITANPLMRWRLANASAYRWSNFALFAAIGAVWILAFVRWWGWSYCKRVVQTYPASMRPMMEAFFFDPIEAGLMNGVGAPWEILACHSQAWAIQAILAVMALYLLREAALLWPRRRPIFPEEWRILPLSPGQIIVAQWDWPFLKCLLALAAALPAFFLPHRIVFPFPHTTNDWIEGYYALKMFLVSEALDANMLAVRWAFVGAALLFSVHRSALLTKAMGARWFRSRWLIAWLIWTAIIGIVSFRLLPAFEHSSRISAIALHLAHIWLVFGFLRAPGAIFRHQFERE